MDIYTPANESGVTIDTSRPIVIFDPWPFNVSEIGVFGNTPHYFYGSDGRLTLRQRVSAIHAPSALGSASFLAWATDGLPVLGKSPSLYVNKV